MKWMELDRNLVQDILFIGFVDRGETCSTLSGLLEHGRGAGF